MPTSLEIVKKFFPDVEHVKDATKNVEIEVTRTDLRSTAVKDHKACVMAKACTRALNLDGAVVSLGTVYLVKDDTATRYKISAGVTRELVAFDRGGAFAPGTYELRKPERATQRAKPARRGGLSGRDRAPSHQTSGIRTKLTALP